jgi:glycosyltransferase involved in cell wall biosynthesis
MHNAIPAISVIMPAYNAEKFIGEAIQSVLDQSFPDFEFIIINDGSTDATPFIVRSFNDARIRLINQENRGIAEALNLGLAAARADMIARFDADDICYPWRLEVQYAFLKLNPGYILAGGAADYIDQVNQHVFTWTPDAMSNTEIMKVYKQVCPFIHSGVMFRKDAVIAAGGYNPHAHSFEDHFLWVKLLNKGWRAANLPTPLIQVRLNPDSVTIDEKWRGRKFRKLKYHSLKKGKITEAEGNAIRQILNKQDKDSIKEGAYYALLGKKYLWNNYQPAKARESFRKAISMRPFHLAGYGLFALSYLSESFISRIYKTMKLS